VFFAPSIGYYVVTRHAEIEQVFRDNDTDSAAITQAPLVLARGIVASQACARRILGLVFLGT